ncbi:MAG: hypothetical protein IJU56_08670, partial [Clostridia bacterium]|nr:hypothetical protein [Clostridia bacterium]
FPHAKTPPDFSDGAFLDEQIDGDVLPLIHPSPRVAGAKIRFRVRFCEGKSGKTDISSGVA